MLQSDTTHTQSKALVSRSADLFGQSDRYLAVSHQGAPVWVEDPSVATVFPSMREATRMALRLPAQLKAYGVLRDVEIHNAAEPQSSAHRYTLP